MEAFNGIPMERGLTVLEIVVAALSINALQVSSGVRWNFKLRGNVFKDLKIQPLACRSHLNIVEAFHWINSHGSKGLNDHWRCWHSTELILRLHLYSVFVSDDSAPGDETKFE